MDKTTFKKCVALAGIILEIQRLELGKTLVERWTQWYEEHGERREDLLRELIGCSGKFTAAWAVVNRIAQDYLRTRRPLPPELADWLANVLDGTGRRPKPRRKDPCDNANRNHEIVTAISYLVGQGLHPTRNIARFIAKKGQDYPKCCWQGGSACDAVGGALKEVYGESLGYKSIERIWTERASSGIPLRSLSLLAVVLSPTEISPIDSSENVLRKPGQ